MTKDQLIVRITRLRNIINDIDLDLCKLFGPNFDEDYKVERLPLRFEAFDLLNKSATELAQNVTALIELTREQPLTSEPSTPPR